MSPVAIVTGGSRGIGAATARRLAAAGWDVCLSYRDDAAAADEVVASCRGSRRVRADVSSEDDVLGLFAAADEMGRLGVLVNNVGVVGPPIRVDQVTRERIDRMLAVNVVGPFLCAREAMLRMSTRHGGTGGVIVNVGSIAARIGSPREYVDYAASKAAVDTMTQGLALEVADEGVRVACVRPGIIDTDIHASGGQPDRAVRIGPTIPMGRAGTADEVAAMIAWLCSDDASYVTGAVLDVSGGR